MIINSQRTIYGMGLQLAQLNGTPYKALLNTTLNEKFSILPTVSLAEDTYPSIKYFAIGVGGDAIVTGVDNYSFSKHKATDAALFEHIPFIMRTVDNDLLAVDREKYRFRKILNIAGVEYVCYYLKVIDFTEARQGFYIVSVNDGISTLSVFNTATDEFLNPVPRDPSKGMVDLENTKYVSSIANLKFSLYREELQEVSDNIDLLYGTDHTKNLTEIGICSGVDVLLDGYHEASVAQVIYHTEVDINTAGMLLEEGELVRVLEYGGSEPRV